MRAFHSRSVYGFCIGHLEEADAVVGRGPRRREVCSVCILALNGVGRLARTGATSYLPFTEAMVLLDPLLERSTTLVWQFVPKSSGTSFSDNFIWL